mmetsp:Transcript_2036/g.4587  ORF Transcript_2036/g.4587 Transcript_2036/m.4587 type:complete len:223 (-) Transcript_2036:68-736(-)
MRAVGYPSVTDPRLSVLERAEPPVPCEMAPHDRRGVAVQVAADERRERALERALVRVEVLDQFVRLSQPYSERRGIVRVEQVHIRDNELPRIPESCRHPQVEHLGAAAGRVLEVDVRLVHHLPRTRDAHEEPVGTLRAVAAWALQPIHAVPPLQLFHVQVEDVLRCVPELLAADNVRRPQLLQFEDCLLPSRVKGREVRLPHVIITAQPAISCSRQRMRAAT